MALLVFSFGIFYGFTETISAQTDMDTTAKLNPINSWLNIARRFCAGSAKLGSGSGNSASLTSSEITDSSSYSNALYVG
jgi:hypothetical protein